MTQSMSRVGKCIDNGPMEEFWGILKRERYYGKRFTDKETLVKMIEDYIDYYNNKVSAKYSCGFSNLLDSSIIVNER